MAWDKSRARRWSVTPLPSLQAPFCPSVPFTSPPPPLQVWFYPKFHYVPNPDAINLNDFPNSYAFQAPRSLAQ